jgi:hypothetical protein
MGKECPKHVEFLEYKHIYCDIKLDTYTYYDNEKTACVLNLVGSLPYLMIIIISL